MNRGSSITPYLSRRILAKNLRFSGEMGSKCKILFSGPPKGISLRETASFDVLIVKIGAGVLAVGCRKKQKKLDESLDAQFRIFGGQRGESYRDKILHRGRGHRRNHPCKFW